MDAFAAGWWGSPVLYVVGGLGPGMAAYLVMRALYGETGERRLREALLRWRVGAAWAAVALLTYVVIHTVAAVLAGGSPQALIDAAAWVALVPSLLLYVVLAVPEEVGWRGFAQPHLQARHSALTSSLAVGLLWALWHLPLRLNLAEAAIGSSHLAWAIGTVAAAVIYAWLFNSTGGSVLAVVVLHAVGNTMSNFAAETAGDTESFAAAITVAIAVVLAIACGPRHLARGRRAEASPEGAATAASRGASMSKEVTP